MADPKEEDLDSTAEEDSFLPSSMTELDDIMGNGETWRNLVSYWFLGLTNNFAYIIMLSAAHDILSHDFDATIRENRSSHSASDRDCNNVSTGTILLADIIPSLIMKSVSPFIATNFHGRVLVVVTLCTCSFLLVGNASSQLMAIAGVVCASASSGLGETTFLAYSAYFHRNVISFWSSGTGGAGLFGSLSYAGLTSAGFTPRTTVLFMLVVPVVMSFSFWVGLDAPHIPGGWKVCRKRVTTPVRGEREVLVTQSRVPEAEPLTVSQKLALVPCLAGYMVPLALVYVAEYLINQGLFELIYFPVESGWLNHHEQYRWYQVSYQLGVMISRSSVNLIHFKRVWMMTLLQWLNVVWFLSVAIYWWVDSIWWVLAAILWEGLLGGGAYVNTFYRMAHEVPKPHKEFAMSITALSDTSGITLAGFLAIPLHNAICRMPL